MMVPCRLDDSNWRQLGGYTLDGLCWIREPYNRPLGGYQRSWGSREAACDSELTVFRKQHDVRVEGFLSRPNKPCFESQLLNTALI